MNKPDVPLLPLTGWGLASLPDQCVMLKLDFITSPFDRTGQSRNHAMTAAQARELGQALQRAADAAEKRTDRPAPQ